jgi:hypothetical protein
MVVCLAQPLVIPKMLPEKERGAGSEEESVSGSEHHPYPLNPPSYPLSLSFGG